MTGIYNMKELDTRTLTQYKDAGNRLITRKESKNLPSGEEKKLLKRNKENHVRGKKANRALSYHQEACGRQLLD